MSVFVRSWKKCPRICSFLDLLWTVTAKRYVPFNNVMLLTRNISKYFAEKGYSCNLLLGLTWFESPCPLNFSCLWKLFSLKLKWCSIVSMLWAFPQKFWEIFYRIHVLRSSSSSHTMSCCCWRTCNWPWGNLRSGVIFFFFFFWLLCFFGSRGKKITPDTFI